MWNPFPPPAAFGLAQLTIMNRLLNRLLGPQSGNTLWMMADKVLRIFGGLIIGALVARHLGPLGFGQLSLALTVLGFFAVFSTLGMDPIAVRHFSVETDNVQRANAFKTLLVMRMLGGAVGYFALLAIVWLASPWDYTTHALCALIGLGLICQAADTIDLWFQAKVAVRQSVMAKTTAYMVAVLWRVAMIATNAHIHFFALATVVEGVIAAGLLALLFVRGKEIHGFSKFDASIAKSFFLQSWPLIGAAFAISIYNRTDQIVLARLMGVEAVGLYTAAVRISEAWYFIPVTIVVTAAPTIARLYAKSRKDALETLEALFRRLILIGIAVSFSVMLIAPWLIDMLFGAAYEKTAAVLAIHVWAGIFVSLGVAQGPWFVNEGLTRLTLYRAVIGAGASVVLNLILVPIYGIVGCAISILLVQGFANVGLNAIFPPARPIFAAQMRALMVWRSLRIS